MEAICQRMATRQQRAGWHSRTGKTVRRMRQPIGRSRSNDTKAETVQRSQGSTIPLMPVFSFLKTLVEYLIDRVCEVAQWERYSSRAGYTKPPANLQLQADQHILGPSQRSAHDNAGSESRLRCSLTSRCHEIQGHPPRPWSFNASNLYTQIQIKCNTNYRDDFGKITEHATVTLIGQRWGHLDRLTRVAVG